MKFASKTFPTVSAAAKYRDEIDVLHSDADRDYESVKADFEVCAPKVRRGGCALFHDTESCDGVRRPFSELHGRKSALTEHHGLGCWYKDGRSILPGVPMARFHQRRVLAPVV